MRTRTELVKIVTVDPDARGHHYLTVILQGMDGEQRKIRFLVDTGATKTAIRESDLRGFAFIQKPKPSEGYVVLADGRIEKASAAIVLYMYIGPIRLGLQRINVMPDKSLDENLLGMSALKYLNMRMHDGRLTFVQRISPAS
jgi:clan AA aspartic protease (TIGR02281 family)